MSCFFFSPFSVSWSFLNARECLQNQLWKAGQDAAPRGLKKKSWERHSLRLQQRAEYLCSHEKKKGTNGDRIQHVHKTTSYSHKHDVNAGVYRKKDCSLHSSDKKKKPRIHTCTHAVQSPIPLVIEWHIVMLHLNERDHNREGGLTCLLPARVCERLERSVLIAGLHEKHEKKKRSFFFF